MALALQKPIEDLLGAVSLYSQQPMQMGDLCKYGTVLGVIEEIGLRTTRIRTLSDTLVSVPNCISAYLAVVGELNMSIMRIIEDAGAHFARGHKRFCLSR